MTASIGSRRVARRDEGRKQQRTDAHARIEDVRDLQQVRVPDRRDGGHGEADDAADRSQDAWCNGVFLDSLKRK
jgi:hypothetical protein